MSATVRGVQQAATEIATRLSLESYYELAWPETDPLPAVSTPAKRPNSSTATPTPKRPRTADVPTPAIANSPALPMAPLEEMDDSTLMPGAIGGIATADLVRAVRHISGTDPDDSQLAYRQLGNTSRRLSVVEISGLAGADASRVVHDLNRMFVHHNVDDMWQVIAARCSATGYVDPGGNGALVGEGRSAGATLGRPPKGQGPLQSWEFRSRPYTLSRHFVQLTPPLL